VQMERPDQPEIDTRPEVGFPDLSARTSCEDHAVAINEELLRPVHRDSVPVLTALDDGSYVSGESFRLRDDEFVIGRKEGNLVIGIDRVLSSRHAVLRRIRKRNQTKWLLVDLDTPNGTFVRVTSCYLAKSIVVLLGSSRFRLVERDSVQLPEHGDSTANVDAIAGLAAAWPTFEETGLSATKAAFPLQKPEVTIGRVGSACDIELNDHCLASHHATLERMGTAQWRIRAESTLNGVWTSIRSVQLTNHCFFRCGEQAFRFVIP
jgi:pSer/pThr/pTyr-binding forkhead associated (FHA) protein